MIRRKTGIVNRIDAVLFLVSNTNLAVTGAVDPVDDAGLGGGFAAACRAGDQDHTGGLLCQRHYRFRDPPLLSVGNVKGHHPDHCGHGAALPVGVDAETGKTRHRKGKIVVAPLQQGIHGTLGRGIHPGDRRFRICRHQTLLRHGVDMPLPLFTDSLSGHEEQVRCFVLHGKF